MTLISLVIPCYNESLSIPTLFRKAKYITSNYDIEIIFVDNGSKDKTWEIMQDFNLKNKIKFIRLKNNQGYGKGIKFGLEYATGSYIGWTHADLQTDLFDIMVAYENIQKENLKNNKQNLLAIKGIRYGRTFFENFISFGMSTIGRLFFFPWDIKEINAQPSIYHSSIKEYLNKSPNDYNFDIYAYLISFYLNFKHIRFPVLFPSRIYGKSHWNINPFSRFKFIINTFIFMFKIFLKFKNFK